MEGQWLHGIGGLTLLPGPPSANTSSAIVIKLLCIRPRVWCDLSVISTDKHWETVKCGISQAVCLAAAQSSGKTYKICQMMGGTHCKLTGSCQL